MHLTTTHNPLMPSTSRSEHPWHLNCWILNFIFIFLTVGIYGILVAVCAFSLQRIDIVGWATGRASGL